MRKLRLDLDALDVESFTTDLASSAAGTVQGLLSVYCTPECDTVNQTCNYASCGGPTCYGNGDTCFNSCGDCGSYYCEGGSAGFSCVASCAYTCSPCNPSVNEIC
jgi:hypothetical protein